MKTILNENSKTDFRTSDLPLAATLQIKDCQIDSLDRTDPGRVIFVFKKNEQLDRLIGDYWAQKIKVEPRKFFESLKSLKTRIYQQ